MYIILAMLNGTDVNVAIEQSKQHWETREQLLNKMRNNNETPTIDQQSSDRSNHLPSTLGDRSRC